MFNRKIVEFEIAGETKYTIRRWTPFGFQYKDLHGRWWWSLGSEYFNDCLGTKKQVIRRLLCAKNVMSTGDFLRKHVRTKEEVLEDERLERIGVDQE